MKKNLFRFLAALAFAAFAALASTGCSSTNITKLAAAMAKDPSANALEVTTIYGNVKFRRAGCLPGQTTTIATDGSMTVSMENSNAQTVPVKATLRLSK
jgi:hypothetical protein